MLKIIFLADCISTQQAGIFIYAKNLVRKFLEEYPDNDYSLITSKKIDEFSIRQIVVPVNDRIPFHFRFRQLVQIPRIVNRLNPDLVIELAHFGPFFLRPEIKRVTVIHDLTPLSHPAWHPFSSVIFHRLLIGGIIRRADYIITNSRQTKNDIVRRFQKPDEKIVISLPYLDDLFLKDPETGSYSSSGNYFLTVGTIEPRKNQSTIIRAFDKFCTVNDQYRLVIVGGDGWKNREFYDALKRSPNRNKITVTGFLPRAALIDRYRNAKAFIFASFYEGFGLSILEASYFSLPLVLSQNESVPSWFKERALLFEPTDYLQLHAYLIELVQNRDTWEKWQQKSREANMSFRGEQSELGKILK